MFISQLNNGIHVTWKFMSMCVYICVCVSLCVCVCMYDQTI